MAVKENAEAKETFNPSDHAGFHVMRNNRLLGTYETEADAQAFIDAHLVPQKLDGKIVEGADEAAE